MAKNIVPETVVLKAKADRREIDEFVDSKKARYFRHLFSRPKRHEIHVHSVALVYEPYVILSGTYEADFFKSASYSLKTPHNVKEIIIGDGVFPISERSTFLKRLEGRRGKNTVKLTVDEHVFVNESLKLVVDHHGKERKFPYRLSSSIKENYPKRVLGKNSVKELETSLDDAVNKLEKKARRKHFNVQVKDLKERFSVDSIVEVYVPIYEARLVGPRKRVQIMRIDAVKKKVI